MKVLKNGDLEAIPPGVHAGGAVVVVFSGSESETTLNIAPSNVTLVLGLNNAVLWINEDAVSHNVNSKTVPQGTPSFTPIIWAEGAQFEG